MFMPSSRIGLPDAFTKWLPERRTASPAALIGAAEGPGFAAEAGAEGVLVELGPEWGDAVGVGVADGVTVALGVAVRLAPGVGLGGGAKACRPGAFPTGVSEPADAPPRIPISPIKIRRLSAVEVAMVCELVPPEFQPAQALC